MRNQVLYGASHAGNAKRLQANARHDHYNKTLLMRLARLARRGRIILVITSMAVSRPITAEQMPPLPQTEVPNVDKPTQGNAQSELTNLGYQTGIDLYKRCTDQSAAGLSYCFAYLAAVHDTVRAYENWMGFKEFCLPREVTQSDLRQVFLADARRFTFEARGQAASVVVNAFKRAYKCPTTAP